MSQYQSASNRVPSNPMFQCKACNTGIMILAINKDLVVKEVPGQTGKSANDEKREPCHRNIMHMDSSFIFLLLL